jgi:rRNA processing protein Krr1/Pno1
VTRYTVKTHKDGKDRQHCTVSVDGETVAIMGTQEQATEWVAKEVERRAFCLRNWEVET